MTLRELNSLSTATAMDELRRCCGSTRWVKQMAECRPFSTQDQVLAAADEIWQSLSESDWKEAFARHPKIGDVTSLQKQLSSTARWASSEQASVATASENILRSLADGNQQYEVKFGYIFIVCATGKSANEMLAILNRRMSNPPDKEILIAASEQASITRLRLQKLFSVES
ncbi:MAG: 2-oxo-4-hydroxy-4-carboxy-5-ureidoimidazoline decarboxylase [Bacteroidetes bacterium]|nr:2-oxo-4-hydroxy-4-carboxy-5-ureidoimidazoline decarboxylase [Bacteroidota bacterium]MCW5895163.1 2-oxo-4-hydroxy-4-carboxy-5-ureidoimidazoline decarboxylase [Bacteroidota bacterium]